MDAIIFALFTIIFVLILMGQRKLALYGFFIALVVVGLWFNYHVDDPLNLNF